MKVKRNSFPYERLCNKTRFETEGKENLEMAYPLLWVWVKIRVCSKSAFDGKLKNAFSERTDN